jgi:hypothetical protein
MSKRDRPAIDDGIAAARRRWALGFQSRVAAMGAMLELADDAPPTPEADDPWWSAAADRIRRGEPVAGITAHEELRALVSSFRFTESVGPVNVDEVFEAMTAMMRPDVEV